MGKEKSDKRDKKEKKEKRSEVDGVKKIKKDKKDKKEKKISAGLADAVLSAIDVVEAKKADSPEPTGEVASLPQGALVPFANPLASEKETKKCLKAVKKAAKNKTLKRGVKEVVKALRKTPSGQPSSSAVPNPPAVVIIAADISPMDVISHLPVLCEDVNVPYIYVTSRAELGAAGNTKRPTSVAMVQREKQKKKGADASEEDSEWTETYAELVKLVHKAGMAVKV